VCTSIAGSPTTGGSPFWPLRGIVSSKPVVATSRLSRRATPVMTRLPGLSIGTSAT
jgi:hypothetical protein